MDKELKGILERKVDAPGCLDRLTDYSQDVLMAPFDRQICDIKKHDDCPADSCGDCLGFEAMRQLEYDVQTEIILFAEELVARVREHLTIVNQV